MSSTNKSINQRPTSLEGSRNDNTPIRSSDNKTIRPTKRPALSSPSSKEDAPLTYEGIRIIIDDALKSHLSELIDEFSAKMRAILDIELRQVKDELQDVKQAMQFVNEQFEDIEREHKTNLPYCTVSAAQDSLTKIDPLHPPLEANISIVDSKDLNINSNNRKLNYYKADYEAIRGALSGIDWNSELAECTNVNSMSQFRPRPPATSAAPLSQKTAERSKYTKTGLQAVVGRPGTIKSTRSHSWSRKR
ncbi:unnamed protein product [Arctia plantaginis]|uniref:Uncharacterized protein n=1 Tax=Arctia plantaginis TaxID=874455 RepID=A0A8S1A5V8_ARCPL|nr:unnamed protein product [Arctia plantaginis]